MIKSKAQDYLEIDILKTDVNNLDNEVAKINKAISGGILGTDIDQAIIDAIYAEIKDPLINQVKTDINREWNKYKPTIEKLVNDKLKPYIGDLKDNLAKIKAIRDEIKQGVKDLPEQITEINNIIAIEKTKENFNAKRDEAFRKDLVINGKAIGTITVKDQLRPEPLKVSIPEQLEIMQKQISELQYELGQKKK